MSISGLDPETDIMDQFLDPETDIMGERTFMPVSPDRPQSRHIFAHGRSSFSDLVHTIRAGRIGDSAPLTQIA